MSCNIVFAAALLIAAEYAPTNATADTVVSSAPISDTVSYQALVDEAGRLKSVVGTWIDTEATADAHFTHGTAYTDFKTQALELAKANMAAHLDLKARGTDGDLTCILRGISEDIPKKLTLVEEAQPGAERRQAFEDLSYLLNDNVEVILAPPHRADAD